MDKHRGELINSITHLIGAALALSAAALLVVFASTQGDPWKVVSFSIYGFTLFTLYLISTLYHSLRGNAKRVFRILDHQAIYLLIAGTYTPFTLVPLRGAWGWTLFGTIWGIAVFGFVLDALPQKGRRILPVIIYVAMGWMVLIAINPMLQNLPPQGLKWLGYGGVFYTVGIVFFALSDKYTYAHGIWHLFVLAGSISHFASIFVYVL
ncbi:MAG: hemolysin III [Gammaproteobacteria bacterium SG8_11]|nr:MAG: hemolysin III [Gammaproteobacteria bacterium SG8_11]